MVLSSFLPSSKKRRKSKRDFGLGTNQKGRGKTGKPKGGGTETERHLTQKTGKSDALDILGIGLDAKRDIRGMLGLEAQEDIGRALGDVNSLLEAGMLQIGIGAQEAKEAIRTGALSASDLLAAGFEGAQGFITAGQQQSLDQISSRFGEAQTALGSGREDIRGGVGQATAGLQQFAAPGQTGLQQLAAGATPEGFAQNISALRAAADPLVAERTRQLQSAQGAAGLSRSGAGLQELADVPQDVLLGLEERLAGRQAGIAGQGLTAQQQIAGLQAGEGQQLAGVQQNIANLLAQQGQLGAGIQTQGAQGLAGLSQAQGAGLADIQTSMGTGLADIGIGRSQDVAGLLGAQAQAQLDAAKAAAKARSKGLSESAGVIGKVIGAMFSDKRLKKNIKKVGEINGVNIYSFEANKLGDKIGMNMTLGVIADEVQDKYPDIVGERSGFKTVNYPELLKRIA